MKPVFTTLVAVAIAMLVSGCGGSSFSPPYVQPTHKAIYTSFSGVDRVYGAPGLADPGTTAQVVDLSTRLVFHSELIALALIIPLQPLVWILMPRLVP